METRIHLEVIEVLLSIRDDLLRDGREDAAEPIRILVAELIHDLANGGGESTGRVRLIEIVTLVIGLLGLVR